MKNSTLKSIALLILMSICALFVYNTIFNSSGTDVPPTPPTVPDIPDDTPPDDEPPDGEPPKFANVKDFGAAGDGIANDTIAIQAAVESNLEVFFPSGTYLIETPINLRSGSYLHGDKNNPATLVKNADTGASIGVINANSGSISKQLTDIRLEYLILEGLVEQKGFAGHQHLVTLHGVHTALIRDVTFRGYRGDGIYVGSGTSSSPGRHNNNIRIEDCLFDGVNQDNRNGISVIDVDGIAIMRNTFRNTTRNDMPGPIDLEPNANRHHVLRNIVISDNVVESYGGNLAISIDTHASKLDQPLSNVLVTNNMIGGATKPNAVGISIRTQEILTPEMQSMNIVVANNSITDMPAIKVTPFRLSGVNGIEIRANEFLGGTVASIGNLRDINLSAQNVQLVNNQFHRNGNAFGALIIGSVGSLLISENTFDSPGEGTSKQGVLFYDISGAEPSKNIRLSNNTWIKGESQIYSVRLVSRILDPHTTEFSQNTYIGGDLLSEIEER